MMAHARTTALGRKGDMYMALETRPWTRADLDRLPDDGNRYEVIDGALLVTPPPSEVHQEIVAWLNARLVPYVAEENLGYVYHPRSVVMTDDEQVEPDLMVRPLRKHLDGWLSAPVPLLVIEVLSGSTRKVDAHVKRDFYARLGVPEYWIVDRFSRTVTRCSAAAEHTETAPYAWHPAGASKTLVLDLDALWAETHDRAK
jgi:Uma2 family endonuclease